MTARGSLIIFLADFLDKVTTRFDELDSGEVIVEVLCTFMDNFVGDSGVLVII